MSPPSPAGGSSSLEPSRAPPQVGPAAVHGRPGAEGTSEPPGRAASTGGPRPRSTPGAPRSLIYSELRQAHTPWLALPRSSPGHSRELPPLRVSSLLQHGGRSRPLRSQLPWSRPRNRARGQAGAGALGLPLLLVTPWPAQDSAHGTQQGLDRPGAARPSTGRLLSLMAPQRGPAAAPPARSRRSLCTFELGPRSRT